LPRYLSRKLQRRNRTFLLVHERGVNLFGASSDHDAAYGEPSDADGLIEEHLWGRGSMVPHRGCYLRVSKHSGEPDHIATLLEIARGEGVTQPMQAALRNLQAPE
jgi:hypothetical protein